jgi:phosphoribosylformimino-5-aminoimidazole carboxamide ribotide isomerase
MNIYPAIDLRGGKVVRLKQGRAEAQTVYGSDPVAIALDFQAQGARHLHMVDLDGAFTGEFQNLHLIEAVAQATSLFIELGGGLRSAEAIERALAAGVQRVVIGTRACESLPFVREMVKKFGAEKIAVGIDAKDGIVSTKGWTTPSSWTAPKLAAAVAEQGVKTIIYTDIATDGMFTGPNIPALWELRLAAPKVDLIASGGIGSHVDIISLANLPKSIEGVIIGKALYDGKLTVADAIKAATFPTSE